MKKATIDRSACIGCGLCEGTCPEVFRLSADGKAEVWQQPLENLRDAVEEAIANCPAGAISWV